MVNLERTRGDAKLAGQDDGREGSHENDNGQTREIDAGNDDAEDGGGASHRGANGDAGVHVDNLRLPGEVDVVRERRTREPIPQVTDAEIVLEHNAKSTRAAHSQSWNVLCTTDGPSFRSGDDGNIKLEVDRAATSTRGHRIPGMPRRHLDSACWNNPHIRTNCTPLLMANLQRERKRWVLSYQEGGS
ncbi:LOW QUALITY PROTEIN: hypothetical protein PHMEG_0008668 [Phytophthora megakarya]|uniref:Uncharacterized protein n=1 Tax=Phytophthora megakarya TaxID=4795 RepID=A0A225WIE5_9STRA|nr:LOW QUALITY PROTEIN: hypothetical protein PHMEG_0008668 [Phytophthora megakarya]